MSIALCLFLSTQVSAANFANRKIASVLDELRAGGLTFIYNAEIVPSTLRVAEEPVTNHGIELADEILAAHSLATVRVAPGVYAIVRAPDLPKGVAKTQPTGRPDERALDEIVVTSSVYTVANAEPSIVQLTQEQVASAPHMADEPLRALQRLPGSTNNGFSSIGSIRGGAPNETAIFLDGLRLYEPFHLKDFLSPVSLLDPRIIGGIRFLAGGYSVEYGDRMSAVIDATTVRHEMPSYMEAGLTLFHLNGLYTRDLIPNETNLLLAARRSNLGVLSRFAESDFGEPDYADGFVRLEHRLSDDTRIKFESLISSDDIEVSKDGGIQRARAAYDSTYAWATVEHDWSDRAATSLIASYTDVDNRREGAIESPGIRSGQVRDSRSFHVSGLRMDTRLSSTIGAAEKPLFNEFGVELRRYSSNYFYSSRLQVAANYPFSGSPAYSIARDASPRPSGYELSGYVGSRLEIVDGLTIQTGLRVDTQTYDVSGDPEQWSPRVSLLYATKNRTAWRASWGRFYQAQGINELQVEDGVEGFYSAQHADHSIVSVQHALTAGLDLRVEVYQKDYKHINPRFENVLNSHVLLPELEYDRIAIRAERARTQGVEVLARVHPMGSWSGWVSYAWSRAEDRVGAQAMRRSWDQTHAANLGIVWTRGPWVAALTDSFHSGWPTTQVIPGPSPGPRFVLGERNGERLRNFNSVDVRIARTFALTRSVLEVFLEGSNILDRSNECCVTYSQTGSTLARDVDHWLPLIPSAGILWRH